MKKKFNVLIVGFGYWGPILAKNFQSSIQFNIYSICDSNLTNLNKAKNIYPNSVYYNSYNKALNNKKIDIVIISTPTNTHYKIAKTALLKKKHVLFWIRAQQKFQKCVQNWSKLAPKGPERSN